jgi:hypothetical protein
MFSPNAVYSLSRQSSALASSNSNGTSPIATQSPDAVLPTTGVLSAAQHLPNGSTNERVSPLIFLSPNAGASTSSRRSSSVSSGRTTPTEMLSTSAAAGKTEKVGNNKSGREKGTYAYSAEEHSALLKLLTSEPNSFNSSESSPERILNGGRSTRTWLRTTTFSWVWFQGLLAPCTAISWNYTVHSSKVLDIFLWYQVPLSALHQFLKETRKQ